MKSVPFCVVCVSSLASLLSSPKTLPPQCQCQPLLPPRCRPLRQPQMPARMPVQKPVVTEPAKADESKIKLSFTASSPPRSS